MREGTNRRNPVVIPSHPSAWRGDRLRIALYQPDIPQNTGTILRLAACLGVACRSDRPGGLRHVRSRLTACRARLSGPGGDRSACILRRVRGKRARSGGARLLLLTTERRLTLCGFPLSAMGISCSPAGKAPACRRSVHDAADARLKVPMSAEFTLTQCCRGPSHGARGGAEANGAFREPRHQRGLAPGGTPQA